MREKIINAVESALKDKGKKKFTQSVELIINFQGIDFNKPENRLSMDVVLPKGKGKSLGVVVFADGQFALDAKNVGFEVIESADEIQKLAEDKKRLKELLKYVLLAQPSLMSVIGKKLGQFLGTRDKLPKPIIGKGISELAEEAKKSIKIKTKGKNLPTIQCLVGNENMSANDICENIEAVLDAVRNKVGAHRIKSIYVKLTMGKPHRI